MPFAISLMALPIGLFHKASGKLSRREVDSLWELWRRFQCWGRTEALSQQYYCVGQRVKRISGKAVGAPSSPSYPGPWSCSCLASLTRRLDPLSPAGRNKVVSQSPSLLSSITFTGLSATCSLQNLTDEAGPNSDCPLPLLLSLAPLCTELTFDSWLQASACCSAILQGPLASERDCMASQAGTWFSSSLPSKFGHCCPGLSELTYGCQPKASSMSSLPWVSSAYSLPLLEQPRKGVFQVAK